MIEEIREENIKFFLEYCLDVDEEYRMMINKRRYLSITGKEMDNEY